MMTYSRINNLRPEWNTWVITWLQYPHVLWARYTYINVILFIILHVEVKGKARTTEKEY